MNGFAVATGNFGDIAGPRELLGVFTFGEKSFEFLDFSRNSGD